MKLFFLFLFALFLSIVESCAPSRFVEPLRKKELSVGVHYGGPALGIKVPIPLPITSIEVGYGLDSNLTTFGALHTTALFFGNFQMDAGITYKVLNQKKYRPNISISPSFNFITSFQEKATNFWPILDINAYWNYGKRNNYFYLGINNYFELSKTMANDQPQAHHWLYSPQIGHIIKGKNKPWQFSTEIKYIGPNIENKDSFIPYASTLGSKGAMGIFIGYRWIFKKNN